MIFYLSGASAYCAFLIFNLLSDRECSNADLTSWIAVGLASALWIVVLPVSLIEIRAKIKDETKVKTTASSIHQVMPEQIGTTDSFTEFNSGTLT